MGKWKLDWTVEEAGQCWWELHWLWHSGGVKANLTIKNAMLHSEVATATQTEFEIIETVTRPVWDIAHQSSWLEPA